LCCAFEERVVVRKAKLLNFLVAGSLIGWPTVVSATKAREPADQLFSFLGRYYSIPAAERNQFTIRYCIRIDGHPAAGKFTIESAGTSTPMVVNSDGCVETLPTPEDLAAHATILMENNAPPGSHVLSVDMGLRALLAPSREIAAADCVSALAQANAGVRKVVSMLGFNIHIKRVGFPQASGGVAVLADGRTIPLPLAYGMPVFDPAAIPGARTIQFEHEPSAVIFPDPIFPLAASATH
jgi:hypothetical protein